MLRSTSFEAKLLLIISIFIFTFGANATINDTTITTAEDITIATTNNPTVVTLQNPCMPHQFCQCPQKTPLYTFLPIHNPSENQSTGEEPSPIVPDTNLPDEKSRGWCIYGPVGGIILIIVLVAIFV
ncbi:hypothetical protein EG327_009749 [Venturia inaequalis]|uniref:Uncharacterized protein n=1 Tax=Venturia inaequalis TaxID=5025 RepID=A0A8H3UKJ2_VENIN|nr:hypothetical protein EG327_009749 [Venturia inaequalis]